MPTSSYQPDVKVEIAFNAGYSTPAASRTWTDVSAFVELKNGISITRGRGDEFATTDPNKLTLTLDNTDGRFTAGRAASPYFPNVKIGRPIKVTSTPVGGSASIRFLGYVDEWPVEWNGTDNYAMARITASSRMARLGFDAELRSVVEETFLRSGNPSAYFPLGEPSGSLTASDATGNSAPLVIVDSGAPLAFGSTSGPGGLGGTAVALTGGGQRLYGVLGSPVSDTGAGVVLEAFINLDTIGDVLALATNGDLVLRIFKDFTNLRANLATADALSIAVSTSTSMDQPTGTIHVAVRVAYAAPNWTLELYVNGALASSNTGGGVWAGTGPLTYNSVRVGGYTAFGGSIAHVMVSSDLAGLPARATVGDTTELAGDRIWRLAAFANIPSSEVAADDGNQVDGFDTTGKTTVDAMRVVEATEGGILFDARDNTLTFHGRARRYNAASALTLDIALQEVETGITPKLDRSALTNDVTATASDGSTARATNQTSIDDYGYARESIEIASTNDAAYQAAAWKVYLYGEPQARIPSLGVDLLPLTLARQTSMFGLDVSSKVALSNLPAQASASSLTFFVEGYTETIGHESYTFDFNVSPTTGYDVFVLNDATKGVLDNTTYRLAL